MLKSITISLYYFPIIIIESIITFELWKSDKFFSKTNIREHSLMRTILSTRTAQNMAAFLAHLNGVLRLT